MRSTLGVVIVALVLSISTVVAPRSPASAEESCETDYFGSMPAYYRCREVDGVWQYRYWNGTDWLGPLVDEDINDLYTRVIDRVGPDAFERVHAFLGGDADALQFTFILFAWYISVSGILEPAGSAPTSPESPAVPAVPQPPAQSAGSEVAAGLSPNYRFVWSWGSTIGGFDGTVSGDIGGWTYQGTSISSWPPELHAWGGTATCTFTGDPDAEMPQGGWPMDCDLYWSGDATWTGQISGRFYPLRNDQGATVDFEFKGAGHGTNGGDWAPIEVKLEPCDPGAVC